MRWLADRDVGSLALVSRIRHGYRPPAGRALSLEELTALRRVLARTRSRTDFAHTDVLRIVAETGARTCEIRKLVREQYDAHGRVLRIARAKNGRPRVVVLSTAADRLVRARVDVTAPGGWLFPNARTGRPWTHQHLNRVLGDVALDAGVRDPRSVTLHALRDSLATLAYEAGAPLEDIAATLGHTSTATTKAHYIQSTIDPGARRVMQLMERIGGAP